MRTIANPVHDPQDAFGERTVAEMIFHDDRFPRDSFGFAKQHKRIVRVMQDVNEHHRIKCVIVVRKMNTIVNLHRDGAMRAGENVYSFDRHSRLGGHDAARDDAISAPHIKDSAAVRQQFTQRLRESAHSAFQHQR